MGSKKNKKQKQQRPQRPQKADGLRSILADLETAAKSDGFLAGIFTKILCEKGEEAQVVELSSLSRGALIQAFLDQWLGRLLEYIEVVSESHISSAPSPSRVITFHMAYDSSDWGLGRLFAIDTAVTLDFNDLQQRMQRTIQGLTMPSLAVWLKIDTSGMDRHTIIIRADEDNEVVVVAAPDPTEEHQTIAGKKQVALIGKMMYGDSHISVIEPWMAYIDEMAEGFKKDHLASLQELLSSWGMSEPIDDDRWTELSQLFYTNEKFLEFVMGAGMIHAKPYLKEAHNLTLSNLTLTHDFEEELSRLQTEHEAERERERKRVLKSIERSELQARGAQDLAQRTMRESADLKSKVARLERFGGTNEDRSERMQQSFGALFRPVLQSLEAAAA